MTLFILEKIEDIGCELTFLPPNLLICLNMNPSSHFSRWKKPNPSTQDFPALSHPEVVSPPLPVSPTMNAFPLSETVLTSMASRPLCDVAPANTSALSLSVLCSGHLAFFLFLKHVKHCLHSTAFTFTVLFGLECLPLPRIKPCVRGAPGWLSPINICLLRS